MTEERLARRYRALLAFYPRRYREERGEELVGTLLDCARPGQARPTWREARSLLVEGLRTGAPRVTGADVLRLGVLGALVMWTLGTIARFMSHAIAPSGVAVLAIGVAAYGAVPLTLVALGRVRPAVPFVVVGALSGFILSALVGSLDGTPGLHLPMFSVIALAGLAALWRHPDGRAPAGALALTFALAPPLLLAVPAWLPYDWPIATVDIFWFGQMPPIALMYLGALAYAGVDPRPAIAMAVFLTLHAAQVVMVLGPSGVRLTDPAAFLAVLLAAAAIAAGAAGLGVRRQVAARPAKVEG